MFKPCELHSLASIIKSPEKIISKSNILEPLNVLSIEKYHKIDKQKEKAKNASTHNIRFIDINKLTPYHTSLIIGR